MFPKTLLVRLFGLSMEFHIWVFPYAHFLHLLLYSFQLFDSGDSVGLFVPVVLSELLDPLEESIPPGDKLVDQGTECLLDFCGDIIEIWHFIECDIWWQISGHFSFVRILFVGII